MWNGFVMWGFLSQSESVLLIRRFGNILLKGIGEGTLGAPWNLWRKTDTPQRKTRNKLSSGLISDLWIHVTELNFSLDSKCWKHCVCRISEERTLQRPLRPKGRSLTLSLPLSLSLSLSLFLTVSLCPSQKIRKDGYMHTYIHTCMHACMHAYIQLKIRKKIKWITRPGAVAQACHPSALGRRGRWIAGSRGGQISRASMVKPRPSPVKRPKISRAWSCASVISATREAELRQENRLNLGGGGCSEPRSRRCTPAWARERGNLSKKYYYY